MDVKYDPLRTLVCGHFGSEGPLREREGFANPTSYPAFLPQLMHLRVNFAPPYESLNFFYEIIEVNLLDSDRFLCMSEFCTDLIKNNSEGVINSFDNDQ